MIMLHKNDKIIILIAVIVIVLAGIGIAAYNAPETSIDDIDTDELKPFAITWASKKSPYSTDTFTAEKNNPYTDEMTIDKDNLLTVTFKLTWNDDSTYGILRTKGEDTLMVDITYNGQTKSAESTGNGTHELTFTINSMPTIDSIEAIDEAEAREQIMGEYYITSYPTFDIEVAVQTGESILRPLKFIRDKGNSFDLDISYGYFMVDKTEEEIKDTAQNNNDLDDLRELTAPPSIGMIINTGCGRFV